MTNKIKSTPSVNDASVKRGKKYSAAAGLQAMGSRECARGDTGGGMAVWREADRKEMIAA